MVVAVKMEDGVYSWRMPKLQEVGRFGESSGHGRQTTYDTAHSDRMAIYQ